MMIVVDGFRAIDVDVETFLDHLSVLEVNKISVGL
jgi:hypothetical protein